MIEDAERTDTAPTWRVQGGPGIEPNMRWPSNQRIVGKPRVLGRIRNTENPFAEDRMPTEGYVPVSLSDIEPLPRFEPLALGVHEADERRGHLEEPLRDPRQSVETQFSLGVEQPQSLKGSQTIDFVEWDRRCFHG